MPVNFGLRTFEKLSHRGDVETQRMQNLFFIFPRVSVVKV